jgi:hypothetical protein
MKNTGANTTRNCLEPHIRQRYGHFNALPPIEQSNWTITEHLFAEGHAKTWGFVAKD